MSCLLREVWGAKTEPATYALGEVGSVCLSCAVQDLEWQCGDRSLAHLIPGRMGWVWNAHAIHGRGLVTQLGCLEPADSTSLATYHCPYSHQSGLSQPCLPSHSLPEPAEYPALERGCILNTGPAGEKLSLV